MSVEEFVSHLSAAQGTSRTARASVVAADSPAARLALGMWRRADDLAEGVIALASRQLAEPIGVLARTLWEGAVTIEYVRGNPEVRQRQLLITALTARRALRNEAWVREIRDELNEEVAAQERERLSRKGSAGAVRAVARC